MADFTLYAEILPELAPNFGRRTETLIDAATRRTSPSVKVGVDEKALSRSASSAGNKAGFLLKGAIGGALAGLSIGAGVSLFKGLIADAQESARVAADTANTIKKTGGAAGLTAKQIGSYATAISNATGADDEAIQSGENMLLTFTNIKDGVGKNNKIFKRATELTVDMAAKFNHGKVTAEGLQTANIQLGKALNDPINGISALSKIGVSFTAQQKEQIKALVKSGDTMGAQKIILAELGKEVGGSAAAMATPFQRFQKTLGDLREDIGGKFLPVAGELANWASDKLIPGLSNFATNVGPKVATGFYIIRDAVKVVIAGLKGEDGDFGTILGTWDQRIYGLAADAREGFNNVKDAVKKAVGFIKNNSDWLIPLAGGVLTFAGGLKVLSTTMSGLAAIQKGWAVVTGLWAIATGGATVAETGLAGSIWATTAAMLANPIGLVVVGLVALGTALFIAYKKSDTFRGIVQTAFHAIAAAGIWMWNTILKPTFEALKVGVSAVATAGLWLWNNALQPAFRGIAAAASWMWTTVLQPTFNLIGTVVSTLWGSFLSPAFTLIQNSFKILAIALKVAWIFIIKPVFSGIATVANWLWNNALKPTFVLMRIAWASLWGAFKTTWNVVGKPIFGVVKSIVVTVFGAIKTVFSNTVDGIKVIWDKLKDVVKAPIKFVIDTIYNKGILGFWNNIAGKVGASTLDPLVVKGLATGGHTEGRLPGKASRVDNLLAMTPKGPLGLAGGEYVVNSTQTAKNLPLLEMINSGVDIPGFADGGWLGDLWGKAKSGIRGALGGVAQKVRDALAGVLGGIPYANTDTGQLIKGVPLSAMDKLVSWIKGDDKKNSATAGPLGTTGGAGGYKWQEAVIAAAFPGLHVISDYRPGARTLSGNRSYHSIGRAVDYAPSRPLAKWIHDTYGKNTQELITPYPEYNLWHGAPHTYTGAVWNQHNFAGGNAHDHWAYDQGGWLGPNQRGMNNLRKPEAVLTPKESKGLMDGNSINGRGVNYQEVNISIGDINDTSAANVVMDRVEYITRGAGI